LKFKKRHSASENNIYTEIAKLSDMFSAINLSQGSPDFLPNGELKKFLVESTTQNLYQYASVSELPMLTNSIIEFNKKRKIPILLHEKNLVVIPGATYGIHLALATFLEFQDEVIVIEPCYETYIPAIEFHKAIPVFFEMNALDFSIDWELLKKKINSKTKAIIINTPSNPTGKIWKKEDWDNLWEVIKDTEILVISDEVYDTVCYDDNIFYSASNHPEIKNRCFSVFSFEKMFHISGWKASYIIGPSDFIQAFQDLHQNLSFNINVYAQYALAKYLEIFDMEKHRLFYQNKRDYFYEKIKDLPFILHPKPSGGYFQTLEFKNSYPNMADDAFVRWLIQEKKVAAIPYSAFYHDHRNTGKIRFCFAKNDETIHQAIKNLHKI
jgi:methionine aminotransferase